MDERQFQTLLEQTLDEAVPNVELWPQIEGKLPMTSYKTMRMGFRLGKVAVIAVLFAVTAVAAYAIYKQVALTGDPGITTMQQADMLTPIDQTQSIAGDHHLTVTLDYAYADSNRVTVSFTVRGESPNGERMMAYSNPTLSTDDGQPLDRLFLLAEQENQQQPTEGAPGKFSNTLTSNFIARDFGLKQGESLTLHLAVEVALSYLDRGEFPSPAMIMAGMTTFTFKVPFIVGTVVEVGQSADAAQHRVTLERASIAPSMTRLDLCYQLPPVENAPGWSPWVVLSVGGEQVFNGQAETYGLENRADLNSPCYGVVIPISLQEKTGEWRVEITEFRDLGDAIAEPIKGSWAFTFTVPEN